MSTRNNISKWFGLVGWVVVSFLPSASALFVGPGGWYESLAKPAWTPPPWVFGPAWTVLYLLMGVAAWRVWAIHGFSRARTALIVFLVHLLFNAAWTWLFFGMQWLTIAAIEIVVLWSMIVWLVVLFGRYDRVAGALLVPYLLWVTYASTLSIGIAAMN